MSFVEKRKQKSCEYILLVHYSIIKKLCLISQNCSNIKLEELCAKYEAEYKQKLNYFITLQNELVLEMKSSDNGYSNEKRMPGGWSGLDELVKRIDFTNVLHIDVRKVCERVVSADEIKNFESVNFYCEFHKGECKRKVQNLRVFNNYLGRREIPNFFDKVSWKLNDIYTGVVANSYDLSKFWMCFADVDILQKHLWKFYSEKKEEYILSPSDICIGINCAVFITDLYYRGRVVRTDIQDPNWFIIFLYDHGMIYRINCNSLFRLHEKFGVIPALAVRCTLMNISPIDNETWTQEAMGRFDELTNNKKLSVQVTHIKYKRKILEVYLAGSSIENKEKIPTINYQLVHEKLAKIIWQEPSRSEENPVFKPLKKYTYLYPTHEMIENGTAPAHLTLTNKLKKCVSWDVLFPELYKYHG